MAWADLIANGSSPIVGFRLMIEGWPDVWRSDDRILWNPTALDGRTMRGGLKASGLGFSEKLIMQDCMPEISGFTARIASTTLDDPAVASFTRDVQPIAYLDQDIDEIDTSIPIRGTGTLTAGIYHVATETIEVTVSGNPATATRQVWDTQPQAHRPILFNENVPVPLYAHPPTMEGRRCILYGYADGDDLTGDGTVLFRGVVKRPPSLEADGVMWNIQIGPRSDLLSQNVAAQSGETSLRGLYHHRAAPVFVSVNYNGTISTPRYVEGPDNTFADLLVRINAELDAAVAELGIPPNRVEILKVDTTIDGVPYVYLRTASNAPQWLEVIIGSPLIGYAWGGWSILLPGVNPGGISPGSSTGVALSGNTTYAITFADFLAGGARRGIHQIAAEITNPMTALGYPFTPYYDPNGVFPEFRLNVVDFLGASELVGSHVLVEDPANAFWQAFNSEGKQFEIVAAGFSVGGWVIDVAPPAGTIGLGARAGFEGFLGPDTRITLIRDYGVGNVKTFKDGLVAASTRANDGDTPFVTDADFATWTLSDFVTQTFALSLRTYRFSKSKSLREIFSEELKLVSHYMRLDSEFKLDVKPLPVVGTTETSDLEVDENTTLYPAQGATAGAWPRWSLQRDGIVNHVEIQDSYDPVKDEHRPPTYTFRDLPSIAEHKTRGKGKLDIKPFSDGNGFMTPELAQKISGTLLSTLARDYVIVEVDVPFTFYPVLVGDVVPITNSHIPNGAGGRGVTARNAICIGRRWDYATMFGQLTLYVPRGAQGGYTPTGFVTDQTDNGGNEWSLTLDRLFGFNEVLSERNDGIVTRHFEAGDFIEIIAFDDDTETRVTGTVVSKDDDTDNVVVQLDAVWTPGAFTFWLLEWVQDTGATATEHQRGYTYVAGFDLLLPDGNAARRFV